MSREAKAVLMGFLTILIFSTSGLLQMGTLIIPFPLFDPILCILCILFLSWNPKAYPIFLAFLLVLIFRLLGDVFFWSFFLQGEELSALLDGPAIQWMRVGEVASILPLLMLLFSPKQKTTLALSIVFFVLFVASTIEPFTPLNFVLFVAFAVAYRLRHRENAVFPLLVLTGIFDLLEGLHFWMAS